MDRIDTERSAERKLFLMEPESTTGDFWPIAATPRLPKSPICLPPGIAPKRCDIHSYGLTVVIFSLTVVMPNRPGEVPYRSDTVSRRTNRIRMSSTGGPCETHPKSCRRQRLRLDHSGTGCPTLSAKKAEELRDPSAHWATNYSTSRIGVFGVGAPLKTFNFVSPTVL